MESKITRLVRACDPTEPMKPGDPRYVCCDDVRGHGLLQAYERSIRRADPKRPIVRLFAGHRGVGKTSELLRLKNTLEGPGTGKDVGLPFKVIYFDVADALDMNDLEFTDLLVFAAGEIYKQLREGMIPGFTPTASLLKQVWTSIRSALRTQVTIQKANIGVPFASLAVELRNRPNNRSMLRGAIERQTTNLLEAVNDLLTEATVALRKTKREGLVLIIDGLDKMTLRSLEDGRTNTHERFFLDRREQLASLRAHVIYTVPISLIYSSRCAQLEQTIGGHNVPVLMIHLRPDERTDIAPETPGMRKMSEMVEARCSYAGLRTDEVFDQPHTGQFLCEMTGGHPRHLMMFLQTAANSVDELPITREAAEKAVDNYALSLLREVPDKFWPILKEFSKPQDDIPKDENHLEMLFLLHIFEYMNSNPWYEVNPVIRTLKKFGASR